MLTEAWSLAQLGDTPGELLLELCLAGPLGLGVGGQGKDPLLHHGPDIGGGLSGSDVVQGLLELGIPEGAGVVSLDPRVLAAVPRPPRDAGHDGVPLGQATGHGLVDGGLAEVLGLGDGALDEAVHHAVLEARQELGGEAVLHEQLVVLGLAEAVDDEIGAVAVGAQQDGLPVHVILGQPRLLVHCLEQGVGDAVGEAHELDVGVGLGPLWADGEDEAEGRLVVLGARVREGDVADAVGGAVGFTVVVAIGLSSYSHEGVGSGGRDEGGGRGCEGNARWWREGRRSGRRSVWCLDGSGRELGSCFCFKGVGRGRREDEFANG